MIGLTGVIYTTNFGHHINKRSQIN